jgi:16S rRNA (uracil1498-N3)-methyltransferase
MKVDFKCRLYTASTLAEGGVVAFFDEQFNYLVKVMRLKLNDSICLFNGVDGDYQAVVNNITKREINLEVVRKLKPQLEKSNKLTLAFAPIKNPGVGFIIQKATELGVSEILPVITKHTVVDKVNSDKMEKIAIEAAEQCERQTVPKILEAMNFKSFLFALEKYDNIFFCDERGNGKNFRMLGFESVNLLNKNNLILVGPEGGFSDDEFEQLRMNKKTILINLGPRILRGETAVISVLTLYQEFFGDWNKHEV